MASLAAGQPGEPATLVLPPGPTPYHITAIASDGTSATHHVPASSASRHVIHVTDGSGNISITN